MRFCSSCGESVNEYDRYCGSCGADLSDPGAVDFDLEPGEVVEYLCGMDEIEFEHLVADIWEELGWETEVTQASTDAGIDVVAEKEKPYHQKQLIQVKRYTEGNTVSSSEVQQYAALKQQESDVDASVIVTSGSFSRDAGDRGRELNVKLIDGRQLAGIVDDLNAYEILTDYFELEEKNEESEESEPDIEERDQDASETEEDSSSEEEEPPRKKIEQEITLPSTFWYKVAMLVSLGSAALVLMYQFIPGTVRSILIISFWLLIPVSIYKDGKQVRRYVNWPKYTWVYILVSLLFLAGIPGLIYLWKRKKIDGSTNTIHYAT